MSREERRQYQRTAGRRAGSSPYPTPPGRRQGRVTAPERARASRPRAPSSAPEPLFTPRFWVRTAAGAVLVGLLLLSLSWDQTGQARSGTESLMYGVVAAIAFVVGAVGYRLVRRRLQQREPG